MSRKEILKKIILPVGTIVILAMIFQPLCVENGILDWRKLILFLGMPYGVRRMFLWFVPTGMGIGGTIGAAVFNLLIGGLFGSVILVWKMMVAVFTVAKGIYYSFR